MSILILHFAILFEMDTNDGFFKNFSVGIKPGLCRYVTSVGSSCVLRAAHPEPEQSELRRLLPALKSHYSHYCTFWLDRVRIFANYLTFIGQGISIPNAIL
jgi:hypothetical protein